MTQHRALAVVSAAQLGAGLIGLAVALVRRRAFDLPFRHGSPEHVGRESLVMGTAYSAPVSMLVAQLGSTVRLVRVGDRRAVRDLTTLGALMVPGYLAERYGRTFLRRWDPVETPVVLAGTGLAAAMVVLGVRDLTTENRGMRRS